MSAGRIVITGMHAVSALGVTREAMVARMAGSAAPAGTVREFEFHQLDRDSPCYRVDGLDPVAVLGKKGLRTKDWATKVLMSTIELGFKSGFAAFPADAQPGLCVGTAFGSVQSIGDFLSDSIVSGVNAVNPMLFGNTVINSPIGNANIRYALKDLSATVATGFNAGMDAVIYAADYLRNGYARAVIAGGLEEVSYYGMVGLARSGVLSASDRARPFAADADGMVPGEGCALFLLETEESARARGARVLAEIAGTACLFDPTPGGFNLAGAGARAAVQEACSMAGIGANRIGMVAACASGHPQGDAMEAGVLRALLPAALVAAYKARTGECYGASGALSLACALTDLEQGRVSGTGAAYAVLPGVNVRQESVPAKAEYALVNSFACDGNCGCVVVRKAS